MKKDATKGSISIIKNLGYSDGVLIQPFDTPSYKTSDSAPYVEYKIELIEGGNIIEVRTLPTLHIYEGREARYSVQIGEGAPETFSIHAGDFTAEWRLNVLRGYSSRRITIPAGCTGEQTIKISLLDPGIVLQEILVH